MFLVLLRALSLLYTPSVLLGSFAVFCDQYMFLYPSKKIYIFHYSSSLIMHLSTYLFLT